MVSHFVPTAKNSRDTRRLWMPPSLSDDDNSRDGPNNDDDDVIALGEDGDDFVQEISDTNIRRQRTVSPESKPIDLVIIREPEDQHRARYLSEGSRGAIKDRSGKSFCTVQLVGFNRPTRLEVFAATATNPVEQHPSYRIIPVNGKHSGALSTPCKESTTIDGIPCIETILRPDTKMTAVLDCIGILKLCTHDMKKRESKSQRNTCIRLGLRATMLQSTSNCAAPKTITLQKLTAPIVCVQQMGHPEIQRMSINSATVRGGESLFIIGKNFDKNVNVIFKEYNSEGRLTWNSEAVLDKQTLHQCHIVCSVPTFRDLALQSPIEVTITIKCGKKTSHPMPFTYDPENLAVPWFGRAQNVATVQNSSLWNSMDFLSQPQPVAGTQMQQQAQQMTPSLHQRTPTASIFANSMSTNGNVIDNCSAVELGSSPNLQSIIQMLESSTPQSNEGFGRNIEDSSLGPPEKRSKRDSLTEALGIEPSFQF